MHDKILLEPHQLEGLGTTLGSTSPVMYPSFDLSPNFWRIPWVILRETKINMANIHL